MRTPCIKGSGRLEARGQSVLCLGSGCVQCEIRWLLGNVTRRAKRETESGRDGGREEEKLIE